jgi:hypothetical protein
MVVVRKDHHESNPEWILGTWNSGRPTHWRFKDQSIIEGSVWYQHTSHPSSTAQSCSCTSWQQPRHNQGRCGILGGQGWFPLRSQAPEAISSRFETHIHKVVSEVQGQDRIHQWQPSCHIIFTLDSVYPLVFSRLRLVCTVKNVCDYYVHIDIQL